MIESALMKVNEESERKSDRMVRHFETTPHLCENKKLVSFIAHYLFIIGLFLIVHVVSFSGLLGVALLCLTANPKNRIHVVITHVGPSRRLVFRIHRMRKLLVGCNFID